MTKLKYSGEPLLTRFEEQVLLNIARDALTRWVLDEEIEDLDTYPLTSALQERHPAFVTLRLAGELRGCIGDIVKRAPLARTVLENAINAAVRDPRFDPVPPSEVPFLTIEISVLTGGDSPDAPFKRMYSIEELQIGRDGLYVRYPGKRGGLLLPQVAMDREWTRQQFLSAACLKAGYEEQAWQNPGLEIYQFSAQVFSEKDYASQRLRDESEGRAH